MNKNLIIVKTFDRYGTSIIVNNKSVYDINYDTIDKIIKKYAENDRLQIEYFDNHTIINNRQINLSISKQDLIELDAINILNRCYFIATQYKIIVINDLTKSEIITIKD